jgi:hypothetical protein
VFDNGCTVKVDDKGCLLFNHCVGRTLNHLRARFFSYMSDQAKKVEEESGHRLDQLQRIADDFDKAYVEESRGYKDVFALLNESSSRNPHSQEEGTDRVPESAPSESPHRLAAQAVLADLRQRKGIDAFLEELEDEVRDEIEDELAEAINRVYLKFATKNITTYFARFTPQELDRISKGAVDVLTDTPSESK